MAKTTKTTSYKNNTGKGNVDLFEVKMTETPHSKFGSYHVSVDVVTTDGSRYTRAGKYVSDETAANELFSSYCQNAAGSGLTEL